MRPSPNSTVLRGNGALLGRSGRLITAFINSLDMPLGAASRTPAKSKNVGAKSTVETAAVTTASLAMFGPLHMSGTEEAEDQAWTSR